MQGGWDPRWRNYAQDHLSFGPLVTAQDVLKRTSGSGIEHYDDAEIACLSTLSTYMTEFLTRPDPRIGRPGPVCPFTSGSLRRRMMRLTASRLATDAEAIVAHEMMLLRDVYLSMIDPDDAGEVFRSISIVYPRLGVNASSRIVENVQKALKPDYVTNGIMLGQFYPTCPSPGLHDADFRPLQTPVPCFTIRHMTEGDAPFMVDDERHVAAYRARFPKTARNRFGIVPDAICESGVHGTA